MSKAADMAAGAAMERKIEKKKQKVRKKVKKQIRKCIRFILWTLVVLCFGAFIGVHWKVVRAIITGKEMPEIPEGHCHVGWCCKKKVEHRE